jgi:hypothetical protein
MANFTIQNTDSNTLILINNNLTNPFSYTIFQLNTITGLFEAVSGLPTLPTNVLAADSSITYNLITDNIYQLIISGSPNIISYFLMDSNIKACERDLIKDMFCETCDGCNKPILATKIYTVLKFNAIKNIIYYFWNQYVQTQSITDLITPPNNDILYLADAIVQLNNICTTCVGTGCSDCGSSTNIQLKCLDC